MCNCVLNFNTVSESLNDDIKKNSEFHSSIYKAITEDKINASKTFCFQKKSSSSSDEFHKKIYEKATQDMHNLMKNSKNMNLILQIDSYNKKIMQHNKNLKKSQTKNNIINFKTLSSQYEMYMNLLKKSYT